MFNPVNTSDIESQEEKETEPILNKKKCNISKNCDKIINCNKCICAVFGIYVFTISFVIFAMDYHEKEKVLNVTKPEHKEAMNTNYKYRNYFPNPPHLIDLRSDYYYEHKHGFQKSIHHNYGKHCEDFIYGCCKIVDNGQVYELSPYDVVPYDEQHTNCPTYKDLINNYNMWVSNYEEDYDSTYCKLNTYDDDVYHNRNISNVLTDYDIYVNKCIYDGETINCPNVDNILLKYIQGYISPNQDIIAIIIIFTLLFCMGISGTGRHK